MRNPLSILFLIAWLVLTYFYYNASKTCCNQSNIDVSSGAVPAVIDSGTASAATSGPLLFNYDSAKAITRPGWDSLKASILSQVGADKLLEITGLYRSDEKNTSSFENLGIARADAARKLFTELPDDRVRLIGKLTDLSVSDKSVAFESCNFDYKVNTTSIKEVEDKTLIYFPFNSTNKLKSSEVEKYLNDVATRVKASGEKIVLTGHTDNVGDDNSNNSLGLRRATIVKDYLLSKGVAAGQITTASKGESQPAADNATQEGRDLNRRTELQIIK